MDDLTEIRKSIKVINEELGETQVSVGNIEGQLIWIRWLLTALLGAMIVSYFI